MTVGEALLDDHAANGGFPEPLDGEPVRVVAARHSTCGEATRVRIPGAVPARAVRRVRCVSCAQEFVADAVEEVADAPAPPPRRPSFAGLSMPSFHLPEISLPDLDPSSRGWRLLSIPAAAALVIGGLLVLQGDGEEWGPQAVNATANNSAPLVNEPAPAPSPDVTTPPADDGSGAGADAGVPTGNGPAAENELVQGSNYFLALPAGWERVEPPDGATFAAVSGDGAAQATLWIKEDGKLAFFDFVERTRLQLESLAGAPPRTIGQALGGTPEETYVRLAADAAPGAPTYETMLRAAGNFRYSLSTTVSADASRATLAGVKLIVESLRPVAGE